MNQENQSAVQPDDSNRGVILIGALLALLAMAIFLPALYFIISNETKWTVKQKKTTSAFHLAEAGLDRGTWRLQESDDFWNSVEAGATASGYNFDVAYQDVEGGTYRIKFSSGPDSGEVTVTAEGRDTSTGESRAIQAVYKNQTIYGAIISEGVITLKNGFNPHWGPIMAQGNIDITESAVGMEYYPRKFSKQVVSSSVGGYARDINGLDPPNQGSVASTADWWSDYDVPTLPILDFATLRAQASSYGTLNVFGCPGAGTASWSHNSATQHSALTPHTYHFDDCVHHSSASKNLVWYWDDDPNGDGVKDTVTFTGSSADHGVGIVGTVIVRGNLAIANNTMDSLVFVGTIPANAWEEYQAIDTTAAKEYPGDMGYHVNRTTFSFGSEQWTPPETGAKTPTWASMSDVGTDGFLYVGGTLDIKGPVDFYGALWVEGDVSASPGERSLIFYKEGLDVPALNVVLVRQSWREIKPSATAWP